MRDERYNAIKQVLERNLSLRATAAARLHKFLNSEVRSLQEKTNAEIEVFVYIYVYLQYTYSVFL